MLAYSGLILTLAKDKLLALSGVAKHMLRFRPGDQYLASLWRETIITDLRRAVWSEDGSRPSVWRSPLWSWVAINGNLHSEYCDNDVKISTRDYAECIVASVTPTGPDPTVEVTSGYMVLSAPSKIARLELNPNSKGRWDRWSLAAKGLKVIFAPDCENDFRDGSFATGDTLKCMRTGNASSGKDMCLVVRPLGFDGTRSTWVQLGYILHERNELEKYWFTAGMENGQIKIE